MKPGRCVNMGGNIFSGGLVALDMGPQIGQTAK